MKQMLRTSLLAASIAVAVPAVAHHSHSSLDSSDVRTMMGVVTEFRWQNPHVYLKVAVPQQDGSQVEYIVETMNPPTLMDAGWTRDTLKVGDRIVWEGNHDKDKDRPYMGLHWMETADGKRYYSSDQALEQALEEAGAEVPENMTAFQPVAPATMIGEGSWTRIGPTGGRFPPVRTPRTAEETWPLTELARQNLVGWTEDENPTNDCDITGPPRSTIMPMNYKWTRTDDAIIMDRDLWHEPRVFHLDKDAPMGEPSEWGHSVAWFEGDELVVETTNFVADRWGNYMGVDSSEQKHLLERFWLSDDGMRLNVEMTVTDPVYITEPVTMTHQWGKVPDRDVAHAECSLENATLYITAGYEE